MTDEELDKLAEEWTNENYPYRWECRIKDPVGNISAEIATKINNFTIQNIFKAGYKAGIHWIPVSQALPPIDMEVLFLSKYDEAEVSSRFSNNTVDRGDYGSIGLDNFTHWAYLPNLPKYLDK